MTAQPTQRVVFVSTGDGSRAAMASAWLARLGEDSFDVQSAGTDRTPAIDPDIRQVMQEVGVDLSDVSLPVASELRLSEVDLVIVLRPRDVEDEPRIAQGPEVLYWSFGPLEEHAEVGTEGRLLAARRMRDELRTRVGFLVIARIHS